MIDMASPVRDRVYSAIRAVTRATTAEAGHATTAIIQVVENALPYAGWLPIDSAPEDEHVILATSGGHVGEAVMLRDEDAGEPKWTWALGPVHPDHKPLGWKPMPKFSGAN